MARNERRRHREQLGGADAKVGDSLEQGGGGSGELVQEEDSQMQVAAHDAPTEVVAAPQAEMAPEASAGLEASVPVTTEPAAEEEDTSEEDGRGELP
eukprot:7389411-Prorocentrum_lima.AAC.1